jgi:general secretion pathway protein F
VPVYAYKGVTREGKATKGFLDADTSKLARSRLRRDGIVLTEISEQASTTSLEATSGRRFELPSFQRISPLDLALVTRQAATLIGAGIPLVQGLAALTEQVETPKLKSVLGQVRDQVNQGTSFADALAQTKSFPDLYVSMVNAGEAGGALETVLERLADYLESQVRLRNKVSSILIYPAVMFGFAMIVVGMLVTVVLPQITDLLTSLNKELPWYTAAIIDLSSFARSYWWAIAIAIALFALAFRAFTKTTRGRELYDRTLLKLPVIGKTVRLLAISRFSRTLSTLLSGGLPIVRALDTARDVTDNVVLGEAIDSARESITEGASIATPLRASGEFPPMVTHMIEVGERSGQLEAMLSKVADTYEEQVETSITRLTSLLEPVLILVMVGIVGIIIMAVLMPMLQLTESIG